MNDEALVLNGTEAARNPDPGERSLRPIAHIVAALALLRARHVSLALLCKVGGRGVGGGELGARGADGIVKGGGSNGRGGWGRGAVA